MKRMYNTIKLPTITQTTVLELDDPGGPGGPGGFGPGGPGPGGFGPGFFAHTPFIQDVHPFATLLQSVCPVQLDPQVFISEHAGTPQ